MNYKVLGRAIFLSWIVLIACFMVKAFGGDWFGIIYDNTWLEENPTWSTVIFSCTSYVLFMIYYMAIAEVPRFKTWVHVSLLIYFIGIAFLKVYILSTEFHILLDFISGLGIPAFLIWYVAPKPKSASAKKLIRVVVAFALNCGFQSISVMIRGLPTGVVVSNMLTQLIMSVDVLIMLVLYWLYSLYYKAKGGETE